MARKKNQFKMTNDVFKLFLVVIGSAFSTFVLAFSITAMFKIEAGDIKTASAFLFVIFLILGLSRLVTWFKTKTKINLMRFVVLMVIDIILGIVVFFGKDNSYLYSLCGGFFCISLIVSRIFKLVQDHSTRSIALNAIVILLLALLAMGLFIPYEGDEKYTPVAIVCFIVTLTALFEVLSNAFSQLKLKTLFKIIIRTFALEIILGLMTMIVASALIFNFCEPSVKTFADGLWYSFAVVTTIGFGDFVATTLLGRIVTVLLGIYGIIVVAVITSIIVNFYNETIGKHDTASIRHSISKIDKNGNIIDD